MSRRASPRSGGARAGAPPPPPGGFGLALLVGVAALASAFCWADAGVAAVLSGHGWQDVRLAGAPALLVRLLENRGDLRAAWPASVARRLPVGAGWYVASGTALAAAFSGLAAAARRLRCGRRERGPSPRARNRDGGLDAAAQWASGRDLAKLRVRAAEPGRVVLGRAGRRLVAIEARQSLLVVGPTQSGKTSGLAIPAILEWRGPVVATSVKTDLVRSTYERRAGLGSALVYDPTEVAGIPGAGWSPLAAACSWQGARKVASALCSVARAGSGGMEDAGFWYGTAEKLLAPLLFAAASSGAAIADVVRWVDTEEVDEVVVTLERAGCAGALQAMEASLSREERQRSSVYATAETILAAYADPVVARSAQRHDIDPERLVTGGGFDTCYLVAPAHEQQRLQCVFVALLRSVLDAAFTAAARRGRPLDPPLLVVLDEAANVAPLDNLDTVASTAASHGIQLVTLFQDLAQAEARYGGRAATLCNNHRAKLVCSGVADPATLDRMSSLIGEEERWSDSTSVDASGSWSRTSSPSLRRLMPGDALRRLPPGEAVLLYAHLPPVRLALRPYYRDRRLAALAGIRAGAKRAARLRLALGSALRQRRYSPERAGQPRKPT